MDNNKIKEEIHYFISIHEAQISYEMKKRDENIDVRFTTYGNRAGCRAVYDIIKMLDDDKKAMVLKMMKDKKIEI